MSLNCVLKDRKEIYSTNWSSWCGGIAVDIFVEHFAFIFIFYCIKNMHPRRWCWAGIGMSWCPPRLLGPRKSFPATWRWGSAFMGSHTADSPLGIPPGRGSHFKAPDTSPHFRDLEVLQSQGCFLAPRGFGKGTKLRNPPLFLWVHNHPPPPPKESCIIEVGHVGTLTKVILEMAGPKL